MAEKTGTSTQEQMPQNSGAKKSAPEKHAQSHPFYLIFSLDRKQINYKKRKNYGLNDYDQETRPAPG